MSLQNVQSQNMNLVLSTDAKPRLKWTPELHQRFVEAVNQLGGADKATPKSLMRVMGIGGLTLYHLKSHLQKFRLGKSQQTETYMKTKDDDCRDQESSDGEFSQEINDGTQNNMNESLQIAHALRMQMEVQRKLHEQIEVQRHLQLRIEAQGKYLQTVLKKAQDTLSGYSSSSNGIENAKAELLQLISMVNTSCTSSSFSELTDAGGSISVSKEMDRNERRGTLCSTESSLTSSESSGRDEEKHVPYENPDHQMLSSCIELLLMEGRPEEKPKKSGKNRMQSMINDGTCIEQPLAKRTRITQGKSDEQSKRCALFDLNRQCQSEIDTSSKGIDLNSKGTDQL